MNRSPCLALAALAILAAVAALAALAALAAAAPPVAQAQEPKVRLTLRGHTESIGVLAFSPDSKVLVSAGEDKTVRLWDPATGRSTAALQGHAAKVCALAFSPDSRTLASASADKTVRLWDVAAGRNLATLQAYAQRVLEAALAFSPDSRTLASGGWEDPIRLWDLAAARNRATLQVDGVMSVAPLKVDGVTSLAFSPDGKVLACGIGGGQVRLYDPAAGKSTLLFHEDSEYRMPILAFSPDSKVLACGGRCAPKVRLWDWAALKNTAVLEGHTECGIVALAFAPDSRTLASAGYQGDIRLWDAATGKPLATFNENKGKPFPVGAFSPDLKTLATGGSDDTAIDLWDLGEAGNRSPKADYGNGLPQMTRMTTKRGGRQTAQMAADEAAFQPSAIGRQPGLFKRDFGPPRSVGLCIDRRTGLGTLGAAIGRGHYGAWRIRHPRQTDRPGHPRPWLDRRPHQTRGKRRGH